jgi:hypothetical protein
VFEQREGLFIDRRQHIAAVSPTAAFRTFSSLGGNRGWLYANWAWRVRGIVDRLVGGVGLRRGRRDPHHVYVGDAVDFWRVEAVEPDRLLRLRAEMKVPGRAWLQFEAHPQPDQTTRVVQTAFFAPKGLSGVLYWYALFPLHYLIFGGMIRGVVREAESQS